MQVATKFPANALVHRPTLLQYIVTSKVYILFSCLCFYFTLQLSFESDTVRYTNFDVNTILNFYVVLVLAYVGRLKPLPNWKLPFAFLSDAASGTLKVKEFEEACGVGMFIFSHFWLLYTWIIT